MSKSIIAVLAIVFIFLSDEKVSLAASEIHFDFEESTEDWQIPDWAYYHGGYKAKSVKLSSEKASSGKNSLEIMCDFPGNIWAAALVELEEDRNLYGFNSISADVYLPRKAPKGFFQAKIILTVGIGWHFIEMREAIPLRSGKWTTIKARLESKESEDSDWKGRREKQLYKHIHMVKKIAVRIEYNASFQKPGRRYKGPVYVDNIVIKSIKNLSTN